jgi:hypothetical protein
MSYAARQDVAGKIEWEGGLWAWATGYGFDPEDMPDIETTEAALLFKSYLTIAEFYGDRFMALLPDSDDE